MHDDTFSVSSQDTVVSRLSDFTQCTNTTFSKIHRLWKSGSDLQESVLSVLAAVTEVIKGKGGEENEVEYFAALLSSLTNADQPNSVVAAELYLLSLVINKVPKALLIDKFAKIIDVLHPLLPVLMTTVNDKGVRYLLKCLGVLLSAQPADIWECSSNERLLESMLMLIVTPKPSVRKAAQGAVASIVSSGPENKVAAKVCSQFCLRSLKHAASIPSSQRSLVLCTLNLLRYVLHRFTSEMVKQVCEAMFHLMTVGDRVISSTVITVLLHVFRMRPTKSTMPKELNAQLICALYDFQPPVEDSSSLTAWLCVMDEAHLCLYEKDPQLGTAFRVKFMHSTLKLLNSDSSEVVATVIQVWKRTIIEYVAYGGSDNTVPVADELLSCLKSTLTIADYMHIMKDILSLFQLFLESHGQLGVGSENLKFCLETLADSRETEMVHFAKAIDKIFGTVAARLGAEKLLTLVPLQINETSPEMSLDFPRSFLLPVLRDSIRKDRLKYFISYFLPLAVKIKSRVDELEKQGSVAESRTVRVLNIMQWQMWDLLPAFCTSPTDFVQSFPDLAPIIGTALIHRADIRPCLLLALRRVVGTNAQDEESRCVLNCTAKDFLTIFVRLYLSNSNNCGYASAAAEKSSRLDVLETIRTWAQFLMVVDASTSPKAMRKKLVRAFEALCFAETDACKQFFTEHRQQLLNALLNIDVEKIPKAAVGSCYHCFLKLLNTMPIRDDDFCKSMVLRATAAVNADSQKVKKRSAELLLRATDELFKNKGSFEPVVCILLPMKSHDEQHVAAIISTLRLLIYEYRNDIPSDILSQFLSAVCPQLSNISRVVVQACLRFLKTFVSRLSNITVNQYLEIIVPAIFCQLSDCARHFRFLTRMLLLKLTRKFSYEVINRYVPDSEQARLRYIKKRLTREQRVKLLSSSGEKKRAIAEISSGMAESLADSVENLLRDSDTEFSDSELEETKSAKSRFSQATSKSTWIREDNEDEVLNLLDPRFIKHITVTDPNARERASRHAEKQRASEFKTAPDGRIIISTEDLKKGNRKRVRRVDEVQAEFGNKTMKMSEFEDVEELSDVDESKSLDVNRRKARFSAGKSSKGVRFAEKPKKKKAVRSANLEPYAYIPFDLRLLHRRQRAKAKGRYRTLFAKVRKA
ncbi:unnamed protein product [Soboliphyme baturini]|uniref:NUC173 domain-containing protein n=1 Tax=Soboliphyme baturini TaxID=241478 RepID=A0A183J4B0_9BILA|nr:unnamed protein product [Soboliphyme baturini]